MEDAVFFDTLRAGVRVGVLMSAPMLISALVIGIAVGLVQALTSVQELTLTFVPKLAAMLVAFWLSMGFMTRTLQSYFTDMVVPLMVGG